MTRTIKTITVYWDTQDPQNQGWAYSASDDDGLIESGGCDGVDDGDLCGAIDEACHVLGVGLGHDDFAMQPRVDGGVGRWSMDN